MAGGLLDNPVHLRLVAMTGVAESRVLGCFAQECRSNLSDTVPGLGRLNRRTRGLHRARW